MELANLGLKRKDMKEEIDWCDCDRCGNKGFYSIWTHPDYDKICTNCANELDINPYCNNSKARLEQRVR
ncbi:hypothetical protein LCGC14_1713140 [marine sediment metagenome]|uniref:Uncharacterized protein n=1 Tax=marine sediment metagenome TaxID=412755 RepID=A0A0F9KEK5_9ZZZZ